MAKTLIVFLLIAGAAFFLLRKASQTPTEEEQMVTSIQERFAATVNKFTSAAGRAGLTALDTTSESDSAATRALQLRAELDRLRKTLTEAKAIRKAADLAEKIDNFCQKNDIIRP